MNSKMMDRINREESKWERLRGIKKRIKMINLEPVLEVGPVAVLDQDLVLEKDLVVIQQVAEASELMWKLWEIWYKLFVKMLILWENPLILSVMISRA